LGGAPLNFAAHARRLGHNTLLISAVGTDPLGREAVQEISALDLDITFLQQTTRFATGAARVRLGPAGRTSFVIDRPAAYDAISLSDGDIARLVHQAPAWLYNGTLFASTPEGERILCRLLDALPGATRFYDLNLRPGCYSEPLVKRLLAQSNVVKLNEEELECVHDFTGLPLARESFCREGAKRYGWKAVCITLGARGCALLARGDYAEAEGHPVEAVDPVGAGDAFAAAFLHGLISEWPPAQIAAFANRVGALVASRAGAIPDWTLEEAVAL